MEVDTINQVKYKGETYEVHDGFLDLGLLEIEDISQVHNLNKSHVKHLELSSNEILQITGLEELSNLEILNISSNKLTSISGMSNLNNLKILHLASNNISKIEDLENLTNLEELYLRGNQISKLRGLENLSSLQKLDLSWNSIRKIDSSMSYADELIFRNKICEC